jgi:hypothetical protein
LGPKEASLAGPGAGHTPWAPRLSPGFPPAELVTQLPEQVPSLAGCRVGPMWSRTHSPLPGLSAPATLCRLHNPITLQPCPCTTSLHIQGYWAWNACPTRGNSKALQTSLTVAGLGRLALASCPAPLRHSPGALEPAHGSLCSPTHFTRTQHLWGFHSLCSQRQVCILTHGSTLPSRSRGGTGEPDNRVGMPGSQTLVGHVEWARHKAAPSIPPAWPAALGRC